MKFSYLQVFTLNFKMLLDSSIRRIFLLTVLLLFGLKDIFASQPYRDGKSIEVKVGFNLVNITNINEREETIEFDGAIVLMWKDESLVYELDSSYEGDIDIQKTPPKLYQGDFSVKEEFQGWRPHLLFTNGINNRTITNMSLRVYPDGTVRYNENFSCIAETPMDLRRFPFDQQELDIFIYPFAYTIDEVELVLDERLSFNWVENFGIADWEQKDVILEINKREIPFMDGSQIETSEFKVRVIVKRKPMHILVGIILPMVILVSLTWSVFWMDKQSVTDRINISFIGILSVVAYYLVIQDSIPEISYLTLIDSFVTFTFFILAASVVVSLAIEMQNRKGQIEKGNQIDLVCRWLFPVTYVSVTFILAAIFFYFF